MKRYTPHAAIVEDAAIPASRPMYGKRPSSVLRRSGSGLFMANPAFRAKNILADTMHPAAIGLLLNPYRVDLVSEAVAQLMHPWSYAQNIQLTPSGDGVDHSMHSKPVNKPLALRCE